MKYHPELGYCEEGQKLLSWSHFLAAGWPMEGDLKQRPIQLQPGTFCTLDTCSHPNTNA